MPYLLDSWELDYSCHPDCRAKFIDDLGALLIQV
jgi:hypothetical protein